MSYRILTAILAAVLLLVACDDPMPTEVPGTPADLQFAVTSNDRIPWEGWLDAPACGDEIYIRIVDHWVEKYTETPSGRILYSFRTNYKGTATGYPSETVWNINGTWGNQVTLDDNDGWPKVRSYVTDIVFVGHGQVPNIRWRIHYHLTINAPGDVVVDRLSRDLVCQAS